MTTQVGDSELHTIEETPTEYEQFVHLVGILDQQTQLIAKIQQKLNTFIDVFYVFIILGILAAACSLIGLI